MWWAVAMKTVWMTKIQFGLNCYIDSVSSKRSEPKSDSGRKMHARSQRCSCADKYATTTTSPREEVIRGISRLHLTAGSQRLPSVYTVLRLVNNFGCYSTISDISICLHIARVTWNLSPEDSAHRPLRRPPYLDARYHRTRCYRGIYP